MNRFTSILAISMSSVLMIGCGSGDGPDALTENQQNLVAQRIAPVGSVTKASELDSAAPVAAMSTAVEKVALSEGSEHTVKMLNSGDGGNMIFEPAVIKVSKGDTIHFKAVDMSHNSASIDAFMPSGASAWAGTMNQDISVTLDVEGVYVYQCDPHAMMAMIGVVQVGEAVNIDEVRGAADQYKSNFMMNADRLTSYLAQL
ncbi:MAG: pseudoazurin [Cellvibrionales bacterium]|nr:pseudoazurin [Porticoccaceae bacterium]|tara:strand:- start:24851 stop:25453 length:603 start_codon:yes stop_codon:yes gene_type:complete